MVHRGGIDPPALRFSASLQNVSYPYVPKPSHDQMFESASLITLGASGRYKRELSTTLSLVPHWYPNDCKVDVHCRGKAKVIFSPPLFPSLTLNVIVSQLPSIQSSGRGHYINS